MNILDLNADNSKLIFFSFQDNLIPDNNWLKKIAKWLYISILKSKQESIMYHEIVN